MSSSQAYRENRLRLDHIRNIHICQFAHELGNQLDARGEKFLVRCRRPELVQLVKFRTSLTTREVIIRVNDRRPDQIEIRLVEHLDRFKCTGATRSVKDVRRFDANIPNGARKIAQFCAEHLVPWLQLSNDNLRVPSVRMPVLRNTVVPQSKFLPASFLIHSYKVETNNGEPYVIFTAEDGVTHAKADISYSSHTAGLEIFPGRHYVKFHNGDHQILDDVIFHREFIFIDELMEDLEEVALTAQYAGAQAA